MTVDIHTHYWEPGDFNVKTMEDAESSGGVFARFDITSSQHLEETKAVDCAIVFGLRSSGLNVPNDTVKAQVDRAPNRLIFFTSVNPAEAGYMEELERTHQDLGAKGIKLGPIYQGVHPHDPRYHRIYAYAERHNLPIVIHMATTFANDYPLSYARPILMDDIALAYPDLKIVLAHLGHPWSEEAISVIRKQPNVYADVSALYYRPWQFYNTMRVLVEYGSWGKVMFGSDFPFTTPADSLAGVRNLNHIIKNSGLPEVPQEIIEDIITRDSLSILGID